MAGKRCFKWSATKTSPESFRAREANVEENQTYARMPNCVCTSHFLQRNIGFTDSHKNNIIVDHVVGRTLELGLADVCSTLLALRSFGGLWTTMNVSVLRWVPTNWNNTQQWKQLGSIKTNPTAIFSDHDETIRIETWVSHRPNASGRYGERTKWMRSYARIMPSS